MSAPKIIMMPVAQIRRNKRNAKTHSKKQIAQLADSISRFGWTAPIVLDEHNNILAGHARFLAAQKLGLREVPVIVVAHLSETETRALALADNKIAANAGFDRKVLVQELGELSKLLPELNLDLSITGFVPAELDTLLADFFQPALDNGVQKGLQHAAGACLIGDLWLLGDNRLLCGDATIEADVSRLMNGELAAAIFADPPYNLRIRTTLGRGRVKYREFARASGEMTPTQFMSFLEAFMRQAAHHSRPGSLHFICMDWRHLEEVLVAGKAIYGGLKNLVVWVKSNPGQGSLYRSQHELICVFKSGDAPHQNNVQLGRYGRNRSNVWQYAGANTFRAGRLQDLSVHPTIKPVELIADTIKDCTRQGEAIFDPFMGSGTTILAADRTGRRAFGLEIDPAYVDVAIRRWQDATKRDAILASTGQTFDELTVLRNSATKRETAS